MLHNSVQRYYWLSCFFVYGLLGWCIDSGFRSVLAQSFASGSFLPVPFSPIYGAGVMIVLLMHKRFAHVPMLIQGIMYGFILGLLEFITGECLVIFFHERLWTYYGGWINLDGFTNLPFALVWGILSIVLVTYLHPRVEVFVRRWLVRFRIM